MSKTAILEVEGKRIGIPLVEGTEKEVALDISNLRQETGMITIDPGFVNTGSCSSEITFLDGEKGILRYRGYPIEQLAEQSSFIEVSYLLIYGKLPTQDQLAEFENNITRHTLLHEDLKHIFKAFPGKAHPMAILSSVVSALSAFYPLFEHSDQESIDLTVSRLMGKLPTIAAWAYKKSEGLPFIYPNNKLKYSANFLNMMFALPPLEYEVPELFAKALDVLLILHADHEQNCSTSTVRLVGSSKSNLYSSISSGISALWEPLHGGANQTVLEMLLEIQADGGHVSKFVEKAKDKNSSFRLMGFGHRVYKNFDPRATIIKRYCDQMLDAVGNDPLLDIARELEEKALKDAYFIDKKLYPNVDYYSGLIYKALGFPIQMFTPLFAIGRLPGWIAHWTEMSQGPTKIGRPRQVYTGATERAYVPITSRS
ncbi:citrate synthase [Deltaproteobacteria bacterium TL4]